MRDQTVGPEKQAEEVEVEYAVGEERADGAGSSGS
jgi:hypothetical protein